MENANNAKVLRARLMDQPEDFKRLGINPDKVEKWEDGRRTHTEEVGSEVWYFDGTMDDGTKFMVGSQVDGRYEQDCRLAPREHLRQES